MTRPPKRTRDPALQDGDSYVVEIFLPGVEPPPGALRPPSSYVAPEPIPLRLRRMVGKCPPPIDGEALPLDIEEDDPLWMIDNDGMVCRRTAADVPYQVELEGGPVWVVMTQEDQTFPVPLARVAVRRERPAPFAGEE